MRRWLIPLLWSCTSLGAQALGGEAYREVPFDLLHNQIVLRATINGKGPFNVLLDTGTHAASIDIGLAKRLRLRLGNARSSAGSESTDIRPAWKRWSSGNSP